MLAEKNKASIDECLAKIAQHLPGFKHRSGQHAMITAVAEAFTRVSPNSSDDEDTQNGDSILVIEGPTGTGKSLGYLLPAIVMARAQGKKLIVSSATVALQEQLANKDLPFLAQHAGLKISYAIAKGRGRYACTQRLKQLAEPTQLTLDNAHTSIATEKNIFIEMANLLVSGKWSGDRDSLAKPVGDNVWSQVTNDRHGCIKKLCPEFAACPFFKSRAKQEEVDIVIVNHDLLLADIAMGGGVILPKPADTFYCLDEAHHLADKAIQQFAASHAINGTLQWLEKIDGTTSKILSQLKDYKPSADIANLAHTFAEYLQDFRGMLAAMPELRINNNNQYTPPVLRFKYGVIPASLTTLCGNLAVTAKSLLAALYALQEQLKKAKTNAEGSGLATLYDRLSIDLGFFIGRAENLVAVWTLYAEEVKSDEPPIAKWISAQWLHKNQHEQIEYTISASPVSAAKLLASRFWGTVAGAVLTSATLRSLGSFELLLTETGLKDYPNTTCIALESPFNFAEQGKLIIPAMRADPKDPAAHTQEIISLLPSLLPTEAGHGVLMLFSSRKQMQDVAQGLSKELRSMLLMQNEQAKAVLLKEHFARIHKGQSSIIFGLASFAEGLDLPGKACSHLIIAKLPFAVPDDPVSQTRADWITQKGGDAFMEMSLPLTSLKLIQAVGRLIRTETDTGVVAILDTRLKTKAYGRLLCKNLPPFAREL